MKINAFALLLVLGSTTGYGATAETYTNDLAEAQRRAYMLGALEMAISIYNKEDRSNAAMCVRDWFTNQPQQAVRNLTPFYITQLTKIIRQQVLYGS